MQNAAHRRWMRHMILAAAMLVGGVWFPKTALGLPAEDGTGGAHPQPKEHQSQTGASLRRADRAEDMIVLLHEGNRMEIEGAKLALEKAKTKRVKDYARVLTIEHERCNKQIMDYVNRHGLDPRSFEDRKQQVTDGPMERLNVRQPQNFDRAFILAMVTEHGKMIDSIASTMKESRDADLRHLLAGQLLVLKNLKKTGETILARLPTNRAN
jgi:putative membrane protein